MVSPFTIEKLDAHHARYEFRSGVQSTDHWYDNYAFDWMERGLCVVYVMLTPDREQMIGFFSISMHLVETDFDKRKRDWPTALIGQLGINQPFQRRGCGSDLLNEAIKIIYNLSKEIGCRAVITHTYNKDLVIKPDGKKGFYTKNGFKLYNEPLIKGEKQRYDLVRDLLEDINLSLDM